MNTGKISQIIGAVVDVKFSQKLPNIYNALKLETKSGDTLTLEVQQHIGNNQVRAIALGSTDGLKRGTPVEDTGAPISVPVGDETIQCGW